MVKKKWKNAMAPLDFETVWNNAVEAFRASRISEESKNQMDRYFGQFIKHELSGTDCIITVEQPLQVQWFTDLYSEGLAKALCAYGAPRVRTVEFFCARYRSCGRERSWARIQSAFPLGRHGSRKNAFDAGYRP